MKIGILGFGLTGYSVAKYALRKKHKVFISDSNFSSEYYEKLKKEGEFEVEFGGHTQKLFESDIIVKSPGISWDIPILKIAKKKGVKILSEIGFILERINPYKIIAITGTNGKTTTTTLVGEIIKKSYRNTFICGNIGKPLTEIADRVNSKSILVLEVSSYQLEDTPDFHPQISSILNITPDHLEHHKTFANYVQAKAQIFKNQTLQDYCILNYDNETTRAFSKKCPANVVFFSRKTKIKNGVYYQNEVFCSTIEDKSFKMKVDIKIPGLHNIENILAAIAISTIAGVDTDIIKSVIENFKGVEHRLEFVREINGVKYINDSKSTNVDSTKVALESFDKNIWLILGGRDKGSPYTPLIDPIKKKVKGILLIGEAASKIAEELKDTTKLYHCGDLKNAVGFAAKNAIKGDVVLLSPACASFDQFKNFEHRGKFFKQLVNSL